MEESSSTTGVHSTLSASTEHTHTRAKASHARKKTGQQTPASRILMMGEKGKKRTGELSTRWRRWPIHHHPVRNAPHESAVQPCDPLSGLLVSPRLVHSDARIPGELHLLLGDDLWPPAGGAPDSSTTQDLPAGQAVVEAVWLAPTNDVAVKQLGRI